MLQRLSIRTVQDLFVNLCNTDLLSNYKQDRGVGFKLQNSKHCDSLVLSFTCV